MQRDWNVLNSVSSKCLALSPPCSASVFGLSWRLIIGMRWEAHFTSESEERVTALRTSMNHFFPSVFCISLPIHNVLSFLVQEPPLHHQPSKRTHQYLQTEIVLSGTGAALDDFMRPFLVLISTEIEGLFLQSLVTYTIC